MDNKEDFIRGAKATLLALDEWEDGELRNMERPESVVHIEPEKPFRTVEEDPYYLVTARVKMPNGVEVYYADIMNISVVLKKKIDWSIYPITGVSSVDDWVMKRFVRELIETTHGVVPPYEVVHSRAIMLFDWEARAIKRAPRHEYILERWRKG